MKSENGNSNNIDKQIDIIAERAADKVVEEMFGNTGITGETCTADLDCDGKCEECEHCSECADCYCECPAEGTLSHCTFNIGTVNIYIGADASGVGEVVGAKLLEEVLGSSLARKVLDDLKEDDLK